MNSLMKYWHFDPVFMVFVAILVAVYFYLTRFKLTAKASYFGAALLFIVICAFSPLHWLAQHYLFSAHMVVHITLFLIVPPLLILSIPAHISSVSAQFFKKASKVVATVPWLAWILGIGIMWFWHIPIVFNAAMSVHAGEVGRLLHDTQNMSLIIVGLFFWWPVFGPLFSYRLPALGGIIYLFSACIGCSLLGLLITFSPLGTYDLTMFGGYDLSSAVGNYWSITPRMDQQMAGLIMWVPGCLIYLTASLYLLSKWFMEKERLPLEDKNTIIVKTKGI